MITKAIKQQWRINTKALNSARWLSYRFLSLRFIIGKMTISLPGSFYSNKIFLKIIPLP